MPKPAKRLQNKHGRLGRERAAPAGSGRSRSGPGPANLVRSKTSNRLVENKYLRFAGVMFLPVLFGIAGLIMYSPSFSSDELTISNGTHINASAKDQALDNVSKTDNKAEHDELKLKVSDSTRHETVADSDSTRADHPVKQKRKTRSQESPSKEHKGRELKKEKEVSLKKKAEQFQPTFLNSLDIQNIVVDGRTIVPVELTQNRPEAPVKVFMFEGFLTDFECEGLMRVHRRHIAETEVQDPIICFDSLATLRKHLKDAGKEKKITERDFTEGTMCVNASFSQELKSHLTWSYSTAFYPTESRFSTQFEDRVFQGTGLKPSNGGKFQVTSYPEGIGYKTHTDCILNNQDKRDRFGTILVYLQDVEEGGQTEFPELGISVKPRKGRAIVWNNMNSRGNCEPVSVHEAAAVKNGHKYIIQRWYYYKNFYQLGKRAREPDLPTREPGQPRVNCDEYEHGSCRWYDEWNYEHLLDYRAKQAGLA